MPLIADRRELALGLLTGVALALGWRAAQRASSYDFTGRVVLVTGGSRGLGLELAREFGRRGAELAIIARSADELAAAVEDLHGRGVRVFAWQGDLSRQADVEAGIEAVVAHYGRIDVLVNNAGVVQVGPMQHMTTADYEASLALHFWAPYHATNAVRGHMRSQGGGRIVNISSIGGKVAVPHLAPYSTGKFALVGYSHACRYELRREGIVVTTVCPGLMRTGSPEKAWVKGRHAAELSWFLVSDSLPFVAIHSTRAARQIVDACAAGQAELILTPQARAAVVFQALMPEVFAFLAGVASRALPAPTSALGDEGLPGDVSRPSGLPEWVVAAGDHAAWRNLERVEPARAPSLPQPNRTAAPSF